MSFTAYIWKAVKKYSDRDFRKDFLNDDLEEHFCKGYMDQRKKLRSKLENVKSRKDDLEGKLNDRDNRISQLEGQIDDLEAKYGEPEKAEYWNNKYEKKLVRYRRPIWEGDKMDQHSVPVTVFIHPHDLQIVKEVRENDLEVENPLEINEKVPEIYHYVKDTWYDYEYDSKNLGYTEFWQMPFETRENQGDCEDYAIMIASFLKAAGVPSWRIRVVAGGTLDENYGGHATVYVLGDDLETWYHLNSTTPDQHHDDLSNYPVWGEDTGLNIDPEDVWLAFNDQYAWQEFESESSRENFEENPVSDKLEVEEV